MIYLQKNSRERKTPDLRKLLSGRSIILVSNRGPVEFRQNSAGELEARRGGGGLVTAMTAISEVAGATWISAAMTDIEREIASNNTVIPYPKDNPLYQIRLVDIPKATYDYYYNVISNPLLWFIHHYIWDLSTRPSITSDTYKAWNDGYIEANKIFAQAVAEESLKHSNPVVMLQDYHLFMAGKHIRELTDTPFLFHFTHIPWPEPNYMRILPGEMRVQILKGMLSNDLVGFQSRLYASNFLLCCEAFLGCPINWRKRTVAWEDREIYVRTYPISIDHGGLKRTSMNAEVCEHESRLLKENQDMSLIVRTDRSDPSKNVIRGFNAFDALLAKHPELKGKVKFLALLYPTRENIKEYRDYRAEIELVVNDINKRYKTDNWLPIYLRLEDNYLESIAALKCYDVLLVNPIFDGMNLVSKEGPLVNNRDGVLILSENAGASCELNNTSIVVNPFDIEETANAMYDALTMPAGEKKVRAVNLKEIVSQNDSTKWLFHQLNDIRKLEKKRSQTNLHDNITDLTTTLY